jgi:hypothetical protein
MKEVLIWLFNFAITVALVYFGVNAVRSLADNRTKALIYGAVTAGIFVFLSQYGWYILHFE